jgi:hypothetical protein
MMERVLSIVRNSRVDRIEELCYSFVLVCEYSLLRILSRANTLEKWSNQYSSFFDLSHGKRNEIKIKISPLPISSL